MKKEIYTNTNNNEIKNINIKVKFFKFLLIGSVATFIDYLVMIILKEFFSISVLIASAFGFLTALIFNYLLNMKYVFVDLKKGINTKSIIFIFLITSIIGLGINQLIMYILVEKLLFNYLLSKLFSISLFGLWNFFSKQICIENNNLSLNKN